MASESDKKIVIFYVYEILRGYSDSEHLLTYRNIQEKINKQYSIKPNVKSIAKNIDVLIESGYEIKKEGKKGCYLAYRDFNSGELMYLVDAINSSNSIANKQAKDLIERLIKNCSIYERKKYNHIQKFDNISKQKNKQIFYVIEILGEAIEQNKQVSFNYNEYIQTKELKPRKEGKEYIINPYFMVNSKGKYYLVCNYDKYNDISHYKVELISNIKLLNSPAKEIEKLNNMKNFSIKNYINEHIYMTFGETVQATIKVNENKFINDVIDWFGENIKINNTEENITVTFKVNELALVYWALQYGEHVEVIKPASTRNLLKNILKEMLNKYDGI